MLIDEKFNDSTVVKTINYVRGLKYVLQGFNQSQKEISEFIKSEINVKEVELVGDSSKILVKKAKPNFKIVGPKFGKDLKIVSSLINNLKSTKMLISIKIIITTSSYIFPSNTYWS